MVVGAGDRLSPVGVLQRAGVPFRVVHHEPVRDWRQIGEQLPMPVEQSVKTLVFEVPENRVVLAVIPGPARIGYRPLAEAVGAARSRLRTATPDTLALLGMEPGGASPVCDYDCAVTVFDTSIEGMGTVYCGSGRADRTIEIDAQHLLGLAREAVVAPIAA